MKKLILLFLIFEGGFSMTNVISKIKWLGQASVRIEDEKIIYIDPYNLSGNPIKADIILITHDHMDHLDRKSIEKIIKPETTILVPEGINVGIKGAKVATVKPFSTNKIYGYNITPVPAYNLKKSFHPKSKGYVGYIIEISGVKIYHTGDTERIPEMKNIQVDIIMLPLGQTYTMGSVEEATEAVLDTKAKIAIPIHFGMYEGTEKDASRFKELLSNKVEVIILSKSKE
ncbi:MAG: MBL fold metallo-hydrolase [Brevinematales bacterium]|nr:MBL fold metallo-hydrolase [Brevinematales bacterium]